MTKENTIIAEHLFGRIKQGDGTGNSQINPEDFLCDFEKNNSVIYMFCINCGMLFELDRKKAIGILNLAKLNLPKDIEKGMYIKTDGCGFCKNFPKKIQIKNAIN